MSTTDAIHLRFASRASRDIFLDHFFPDRVVTSSLSVYVPNRAPYFSIGIFENEVRLSWDTKIRKLPRGL